MSNRNLKIIAVILAAFIAACSVSNCYIKTQAAEAAVATYTAEQVLIVLLAIAGVTLADDAIENIWDGGHLDTDALLNNMRTYSQLLYTSTINMMTLGSYGVTKLTASQSYVKLLKAWAQQYFGDTVSDTANVGSLDGKIPVHNAGMTSNIVVSGVSNADQKTYTDFFKFGLEYANYVIFASAPNIKGERTYVCLPATLEGLNNYASRDIKPIYEGGRKAEWEGRWVIYYELILGQTATTNISYNGHTYRVQAFSPAAVGLTNEYLAFGTPCFEMPDAFSDANFWSQFAILFGKYYDGLLDDTVSTNVSGTVLSGINNAAAVLQDVIGAGTKAIDDDGEKKLEGDIVIGLPLAAGVAALLMALSTGEKTYSDFLSDLGLLALDGTETIEQINEQVNNLPIPTPSGVYSLNLTSLFPFCIPFDIVRILSAFNATPEAPHFNWTLPTGYENGQVAYSSYTIDLSQFDTVAQVVRVFEYISFVLGLAIITRDLIRG